MDKISIITRTFNSESVVDRTIKSALNQTISRDLFEIVVLDDGSGDNTLKVLREYSDEITLITPGHLGPLQILNLGIQSIEGDFYTILDSGDTLEPTALKVLYAPLMNNNQYAYSYSDYRQHIGIMGNDTTEFLTGNNIFNTIAGGILLRTDIVRKLGGYDEALLLPESDLIIKLMKEGHDGIHVDSKTYNYIREAGSMTDQKDYTKRAIIQFEEKYGERFPIREYTTEKERK